VNLHRPRIIVSPAGFDARGSARSGLGDLVNEERPDGQQPVRPDRGKEQEDVLAGDG
jgi:hypothetical protein